MKKYFLTSLKGFGMGAANVVPGVSGGTIALLTGIYTELLESINSVTKKETWTALRSRQWKAFWKEIHGSFLLSLGVGILVSVLSLAKLMLFVLTNYPVQTWAFFFGLIIASALIMFRSVKGWGVSEVLFVIFGAALGVWVSTLNALSNTPDDLWYIFLCGAISICTMILPGVSGSFILVVLDKYDYIMQALDVTAFNIPVLLAFGAGCLVGLLAFAKFLNWLLARWEKQTLLVLLGFILGSLVKVWPWSNTEALLEAGVVTDVTQLSAFPMWEWAALWAVLGVVLVVGLEYFSTKVSK
jgi:putative membrane protein